MCVTEWSLPPPLKRGASPSPKNRPCWETGPPQTFPPISLHSWISHSPTQVPAGAKQHCSSCSPGSVAQWTSHSGRRGSGSDEVRCSGRHARESAYDWDEGGGTRHPTCRDLLTRERNSEGSGSSVLAQVAKRPPEHAKTMPRTHSPERPFRYKYSVSTSPTAGFSRS